MYLKGTRIYRLSEMKQGQIYLYAETDQESAPRRLTSVDVEDSLKDSEGNILYSFVFIEKRNWGKEEIEYECDLIEGPEGESRFRLYETLDQDCLDIGTAALYKLGEV